MAYVVMFLGILAVGNILLCGWVNASVPPQDKRSDDLNLESLQSVQQQQSAVIQQLSAQIQQFSAENRLLQSKITTLEARLASSEGLINRLQQKVAFTAYFTDMGPIDVGVSSPIVFDHVSSNIGNGYNVHTGVFTAPVSGFYLFMFSAKAANEQAQSLIGIVQSGNIIMSADLNGPADQTSTFVTAHVNAGETVVVKHLGGPTVIDRWMDTSFAGILLYAD